MKPNTFIDISGFKQVVQGLQKITGKSFKEVLEAETGMILAAGYGVFAVSAAIREFSRDQLRVEVLLEPLLICLVGHRQWITR